MDTMIRSSDENRAGERDMDARWTAFQTSLGVLRRRIQGNGASDLVLADLIEDDLRQAQLAVRTVVEYLDETLEAVGQPGASPADLIVASDTSHALEAIDVLAELLPSVRRRLGQVALRLTRR